MRNTIIASSWLGSSGSGQPLRRCPSREDSRYSARIFFRFWGSFSRSLVLGLIVTLSAVPCDLAVAFASGRAAGWLASNPKAQRVQQWLSGSILIGLGAWVIADDVRR